MCLCIPSRIILFGNCPSHRDADDALGWQHWRLLLVLICVFVITGLSHHSSSPESGRALLAEALRWWHWEGGTGVLCVLWPSVKVLSEHRGVILGFWQGLWHSLSLAGTRELPKASTCASCAPVHARPCWDCHVPGAILAQGTKGTELPSSPHCPGHHLHCSWCHLVPAIALGAAPGQPSSLLSQPSLWSQGAPGSLLMFKDGTQSNG